MTVEDIATEDNFLILCLRVAHYIVIHGQGVGQHIAEGIAVHIKLLFIAQHLLPICELAGVLLFFRGFALVRARRFLPIFFIAHSVVQILTTASNIACPHLGILLLLLILITDTAYLLNRHSFFYKATDNNIAGGAFIIFLDDIFHHLIIGHGRSLCLHAGK